jgi:hypothetical protein
VRIGIASGLARRVHVALVALLSLGLIGSFWMSLVARSTAEQRVVRQARDIVGDSLTLVFRPADLDGPASGDRLRELSRSVDDVVLDPSDFREVTLFSSNGQILFSTRDGLIGNRLAGERMRIREAFRGEPQVRFGGGDVSVMVGLRWPSGVPEASAVELTRSASEITGAAGPWRTNMFFLGGALALVILAVAAGGRRPEPETPREVRMRVPVIPTHRPSAHPVKAIEAPQPGLKEEAEARRRAEGRAQAAEERLTLLQEQYRATLEELHAAQRLVNERPTGQDRILEERAVKAEAAVRTLEQRLHTVTTERDRIAGELLAARSVRGEPDAEQLKLAEAEAIGLRAELEGAQTQLSMTLQELTSIQRQAERASELQEELDAAQLEALHARDAMDAMQDEVRSARTELEDARAELRALRSEEQRAAELTDELRSAKAELESLRASHRAELVEREADLEEKVRSVREEFQAQLSELEARHEAELARAAEEHEAVLTRVREEHAAALAEATQGAEEASARVADLEAARAGSEARAVDLESARAELNAAHDRIAALQRATAEREIEVERAVQDAERARTELQAVAAKVTELRTALEDARTAGERERAERERLEASEGHLAEDGRAAHERAEWLAAELEAATEANAELNRRLQEVEARRALEIADDEGRAHLDALLTATQERLAGQTEKLMAAEERVRDLERGSEADVARIEELEAQLRQHQMSEQIREIHAKPERDLEPDVAADGKGSSGATAFVKEMSMDAQKTISRMMGVVQLLKHKREAKDHAQLVQQLTAHTRRLDTTIRDLSDVDSLVSGNLDVELRRTDLEPLIRRVVDESGVADEHDVRVEAESLRIPVDRARTEQIVGTLLRSAADRTAAGKAVTVRLLREKTGAMIVVEDEAPTSEAALSPLVRRLAEVQGGWAKVGPREGGGSEARVFLPAGAGASTDEEPVEPSADARPPDEDPNHWVKAEQALVRELRELSQGKAGK